MSVSEPRQRVGPNGDGAAPPLQGVRVLDFTIAMAGPTCTMMLGDFGADVVKVESPKGDLARAWGVARFGESGDFSGLFAAVNRNKRGIVLDLKAPRDHEVALALVKGCDVLVENFTPGVADRLGIGYESASALNPGVVYCSISGFGQTGPLRDRPGIDQLLQAYAGHMSITGEPDRSSVRIGHSAIDMLSGAHAAFAILVALRRREHTGLGERIDTSLYESAIQLVSHFIADYTGSGTVAGKSGPYFAFSSPYGVFAASDREFFLGAGSDRMFERLCRAIGRSDLLDDERFVTNGERIHHRQALHGELVPLFSSRTAAEWVALATENHIPASLVESIDEVCLHEQARQRDMIVETGIDGVCSAGIPVKLSGGSGAIRRPPPGLGEHTAEVLGELGLSSVPDGSAARSSATTAEEGATR